MMYALVTTHRSVIMSVTIGPEVATLKHYVEERLGTSAPLKWQNFLSHWGLVSVDGLTTHTIHPVSEV